jgi:pimeloyl-ACP methyl ester carboxylesterase
MQKTPFLPSRRAVFSSMGGALAAAQFSPQLAAQRAGEPLKAPSGVEPASITYEDVPYPCPVQYLPLTLYGQEVRLAYMDAAPTAAPNGRTVMLFHGMNFGGFYFSGPIQTLRNEGFRVVVPDQIGFGRSSKPVIPYNFHDMAANSRKLLQTLGIAKTAIVGHSMGGMLAARFAATHPDVTERAVIYNPIGTTDGRFSGQRWTVADDAYKARLTQTRDQSYQQAYGTIKRYFPHEWKPEYDNLVKILYAPTLSADWPRFAWVRVLCGQMPFLDPVVYDWPHIKVKTLVLGGDKDTPTFAAEAKHIADTIPGAELALLPNLGHVPHIEAPEVFYPPLLKFLKA